MSDSEIFLFKVAMTSLWSGYPFTLIIFHISSSLNLIIIWFILRSCSCVQSFSAPHSLTMILPGLIILIIVFVTIWRSLVVFGKVSSWLTSNSYVCSSKDFMSLKLWKVDFLNGGYVNQAKPGKSFEQLQFIFISSNNSTKLCLF